MDNNIFQTIQFVHAYMWDNDTCQLCRLYGDCVCCYADDTLRNSWVFVKMFHSIEFNRNLNDSFLILPVTRYIWFICALEIHFLWMLGIWYAVHFLWIWTTVYQCIWRNKCWNQSMELVSISHSNTTNLANTYDQYTKTNCDWMLRYRLL